MNGAGLKEKGPEADERLSDCQTYAAVSTDCPGPAGKLELCKPEWELLLVHLAATEKQSREYKPLLHDIPPMRNDIPLEANIAVSNPLALVGVPSSSLISLPLAAPVLRRLKSPILTLPEEVAIAAAPRSTVPMVPAPFKDTRMVGEEP